MSSNVNIIDSDRNSNINLLDQTKSILNFFQNDSSNNNIQKYQYNKENNINNNFQNKNESKIIKTNLNFKKENNINNYFTSKKEDNIKIKKESNINNYLTNIPRKNEIIQKNNKVGETFLNIVLNFDYSKYPNKDKGKYYFKQNNNNIISYELEISENKENKNNNFNENNYQKKNNIWKNDFIKNSSVKYEENYTRPLLNNKLYLFENKTNPKIKTNHQKNKSYIEEEKDYQDDHNTNKNNNLINHFEKFNNNDKYLTNNIAQKKYNIEYNYTSYNNSLRNNHINKSSVEQEYLDSLENSEEKVQKPPTKLIKNPKNKYHYNIKLTRNLQDQINTQKNNSFKIDNNIKNNIKINFNYKEKENNSNKLFKTYFKEEKEKYDNKNRSCILSRNDLIDLEKTNQSNDKNKSNEILYTNNSSHKCPKCNCINNNLKLLENKENKINYENYFKNNNKNRNDYFYNNNIKKYNNKHSSLPKNIYKKENSLNSDYKTNSFYLESSYRNNNFIINKITDKNKTINKKINYDIIKYKTFYNLILDFIRQDNSIENIKQTLLIQEDANLLDLFRLFDHSSNHLLSSKDFLKTLNEFGLFLIDDEIKFLFRKFNKNIDELIEYEEFCDIILPKKYSSAKIMSEKLSNIKNYKISEETKKIICLLFQNIIEGEKSNENYRKIIEKNGEYTAFDLFNIIKKSYSVGIYKEDISKFMKKNKYKISKAEIEILMERFDKNRDGMIDYKEFLNEISPIQ